MRNGEMFWMEMIEITKNRIDSLLSEYKQAKKQVKIELKELKKTKKELVYLEEAQQVIQLVAQAVQQQTHSRVAKIVSRCLSFILEDECEFKLIFDRKRGKTEARPVFIIDGNEMEPQYTEAGGVIDITSFALRLSCIILARPQRRKLIVLDEPFKMISAEYGDRIREMLEAIAEELGIQIIMITHSRQLMTGNVIDLQERKS